MTDDPRCPECGEPIGITATYCMHCSADLSDRDIASGSADEGWADSPEVDSDTGSVNETDTGTGTGDTTGSAGTSDGGDGLLDPDGFVDDSLTVVVGILGGLVIGAVATFALLFMTGSAWGLLGVPVWLVATAYLVRRRTVQGAVSKAAYGVALVLLLVPLAVLSPVVETDAGGRAVGFVVLLVFAGIPAAIAAVVGYVASRFVPEESASAGATDGGSGT